MSVQIALGAPATRVASRKLGPAAGSRSPPASSASAACATSTFASTWGRCETVARIVSWVSGSIAAGRAPSADEQPVEPLVQDARGRRRRRQVPGRALEQIGAGVLDPRALGARQRMPADEPGVPMGGDDLALGRADVGDDAVRRRRREHVADRRPGSDRTGTATNAASASATASADVGGDAVDRAALERGAAPPASLASKPVTVALEPLARRERDRAADQAEADDRDPHLAARARRALTAAARPSSTRPSPPSRGSRR